MPDLLGYAEARIYTTPKRELIAGDPELGYANRTTNGYAAIRFAQDMLSMKLFPWQEWLLIHGLELSPDGTYRFRTVIAEAARQNGKTSIQVVLALWNMYAMKCGTVIGTAQNLENADKAWKTAVALAQADDELAEFIPEDGISFTRPKQLMILHNVDGREQTSEYRVTADGRGFSGDLILMDELRQQKNWDSWSAVTNTMNARPRAQTWCFSNAPGPEGIVLRYLRAVVHRELGWPDDDEDIQAEILGDVETLPEFDEMPEVEFDIGFFEWSMPPKLPRNHPQGLAQANPAMNHTDIAADCITYRALISALRTAPAAEAEAEICCRQTVFGAGGPFPEGSWEATEDRDAVPAPDSKIVVCIEVSNRREQTFITSAGMCELLDDDGTPFTCAVVGVLEDKAGTDWVKDYLVENRKTFAAAVIRQGSPAAALLKDLQDARLPIVEWKGSEVPAAHGQMFDRLRDGTIRHLPHGGLDMAATSAAERLQPGGGWVVDWRKSPTDTAALYAAIGAVWGLANADIKTPRVHGWDPDKIKEWEKQAQGQ